MKIELKTNHGTLTMGRSFKNVIGFKTVGPDGTLVYYEVDAKELLEAVKAVYNLVKD